MLLPNQSLHAVFNGVCDVIEKAELATDNDLLKSKLNVRMRKKGDLSNFERGMVVGARRASLSISQSAQ